ncbi:glutathione peroxidase [Lampropedia cohaerens]|uniref:Glutathione peroxidase n=1 Tax=Lampropedia cohaerens TaxID=1610491 RepID=A0A0U1PYN7_9BURK|nr:glutathione peroxidase [Lampropedia cohaerens]KKW67634.1 glutathione peroxidase [Lampropedia cohaerens]
MTAFDFTVMAGDGSAHPLSQYRGKVLLIVNIATECGLKPQLVGLEGLWRTFGPQGLQVLGFPCNQFMGQEPRDAGEVAAFCAVNYGVTFPLMAKVLVNGPDADPLYQWLTAQRRGLLGNRRILWNYAKFLIGRDGLVRRRFAPTTKPEHLVRPIRAALAAATPQDGKSTRR